jgi:hypothetical protein
MSNEIGSRVRYGEAFWRAHHEAWQQSALNQRQYCEAHGIPLKAFGNWRAKFKAEPQPAVRKLLYRRRGFSPINFQVRTNEMSDKLLSRDVTAGLFGERTMRRGAIAS